MNVGDPVVGPKRSNRTISSSKLVAHEDSKILPSFILFTLLIVSFISQGQAQNPELVAKDLELLLLFFVVVFSWGSWWRITLFITSFFQTLFCIHLVHAMQPCSVYWWNVCNSGTSVSFYGLLITEYFFFLWNHLIIFMSNGRTRDGNGSLAWYHKLVQFQYAISPSFGGSLILATS